MRVSIVCTPVKHGLEIIVIRSLRGTIQMRKVLLLPLFVLALAASSPSSASTPNTVVVNITAPGFGPASVNIQNGDVVVWKNADTASHQVVADDGSFKSDVLAPGAEYS